MFKLGITGGIGSGKSYVSRRLEERQVPVYDTDTEAKRLMLTDAVIREGLVALLGPEVYQDGALNKPLLARYLFSDAEHARRVNALVHPRVRQDFEAWAAAREGTCAVVALESAILCEAGFEDAVDAVLLVAAPLELRIQRAMQRDGASEAQVRARVQAQMDDAEKRRRARYVVVNDGVEPLEPQLDALLESIKSINSKV